MATIKSTIRLESSDLFPGKLSSTAISSTAISGATEWQTTTVHKYLSQGSYLSDPITSAKGAMLYAQSPATNTRNICIYSASDLNAWAIAKTDYNAGSMPILPTPLMTLRPGESGLTRVSVEANNPQGGEFLGSDAPIVALVEGAFNDDVFSIYGYMGYQGTLYNPDLANADDVATLEYIFAEQGGQIGTSFAMVRTFDSTYQVQVLDAETGKASSLVNIDLNNEDWLLIGDGIIAVNERGYMVRFQYWNDSTRRTYAFINTHGEFVDQITDVVESADYWLNKACVVSWQNGDIIEFRVFDGDNLHFYGIQATNGFEYISVYSDSDGRYDNCMADGSVVVRVFNYEDIAGYESTFLLHGGTATEILANPDSGIYADIYLSTFSDTVVVAQYDNSLLYNSIQIWNKSGIKLQDIDISFIAPAIFGDLQVFSYGTGRWAMIAYPSNVDNNFAYMFAYDPSTGIFHGSDLTWTVNQDIYDADILPVCEHKALVKGSNESSDTSYDSEGLAFVAYNDYASDPNYFLIQQSQWLKVFTLFPGESAPSSYDLSTGDNIWWRNESQLAGTGRLSGIYATSQYIRLHISITNQFLGDLTAVTIKPKGATPIYTVIADLSVINPYQNYGYNDNNEGISYAPFGSYAFYAFYTDSTSKTSYRVLNSDGRILDTLVMPGSHTSRGWNGFRQRYNSLLIRTRDGSTPWPTWYFNNKSKKFVLLPESYPSHDAPYMAKRTGVDNGVMLLYTSNYDTYRILSSDNITAKIQIPSQFNVINSYSIHRHIGEKHLFLEFPDSNRANKLTVLVYDLAGNLVNTVLTNYENSDGFWYAGDRIVFYLYPDAYNNIPDAYVMVTPTSSIVIPDIYASSIVLNDSLYTGYNQNIYDY